MAPLAFITSSSPALIDLKGGEGGRGCTEGSCRCTSAGGEAAVLARACLAPVFGSRPAGGVGLQQSVAGHAAPQLPHDLFGGGHGGLQPLDHSARHPVVGAAAQRQRVDLRHSMWMDW